MLQLSSVLLVACCCTCLVISDKLNADVSSVLTSAAGARFEPQPTQPWGPSVSGGNNVLVMQPNEEKQSIFGFGTALTESAAYNFAQVSQATASKITALLWSAPPTGNGYTTGRLHLGSADFSLSSYSLDDTAGDINMSHFDRSLAHDSKYVLPLARTASMAASIIPGPSVWSSPGLILASLSGCFDSVCNQLIDCVSAYLCRSAPFFFAVEPSGVAQNQRQHDQ